MGRRDGFILEQALITILIVLFLLPLTILCIKPFTQGFDFPQEIQDEISLRQLRRIFLLSYDFQLNEQTLSFTYQQKEWEFYYTNHHMILTPGTQIFLTDIDEGFLFSDEDTITIQYSRKGVVYEQVLCSLS